MQYQNIFTQVQVRGPVEAGIPLPRGDSERVGTPIQLACRLVRQCPDRTGLSRLSRHGIADFGTIWFVIVGFNMLASVGWDPIQFIRQLFWLALEPPPAKYGLSIVPPLNEGAGTSSPASSCWLRGVAVVGQDLCPGTGARPRHPCLLGLRRGDLAVPGARAVIRPLLMGNWAEPSLRHLPAS
jgi:photosynthetic reaction center M subunit